MTRDTIQHKVLYDGPLTHEEVGPEEMSAMADAEDIGFFNPNVRHGEGTEGVFYLLNIHSPERVVRSWAEKNRDVVEDAPLKVLAPAISTEGDEFKEAWDGVRDEF